MSDKNKKGRRMATIVLRSPKNYVGEEESEPNVESYYIDSRRIDIALNREVEVPLWLAEELKRCGRIHGYREVK